MEKPSREEVLNKCREFAMMRKISGNKPWPKTDDILFCAALKYSKDVVHVFYPEEAEIIWDEAFGIKR